jgi:hypothetical protein
MGKHTSKQTKKMPPRQGCGILWSILTGNGIPPSKP